MRSAGRGEIIFKIPIWRVDGGGENLLFMAGTMKTFPFALLMAVAVMYSGSEVRCAEPSGPAVQTAQETVEAAIQRPISDGTPPVPTPPKLLPPFKVKSTVVRLLDVVEPPPMAGLPPVTGTITHTVHLVEDPGLADPPPPLPALPVTDPAVIARMKELAKKYRATRIAFVSATVYDHSRTYLRCYPSGNGTKSEICGWSNLDFKYFSGFATYEVRGRDGEMRKYSLLMGVSGIDTKQWSAMLAKHGRTYTPPEIPELPDLAAAGPAFVITDGNTADKESMALFQGLHDLYQAEGPSMIAAYEARLKANEQRRAFLLAHPPKPADVTVLFWARDHPAQPTVPVTLEGGAQ